jgi:hypothetical protein
MVLICNTDRVNKLFSIIIYDVRCTKTFLRKCTGLVHLSTVSIHVTADLQPCSVRTV